jgi:hypothetical protein
MHAWSADHIMVLGAEADTADYPLFNEDIKNISDYITRTPGLKADVALMSGNKTTQAIINESFTTASTKTGFFESDYKRLIQSYITKLNNNEMVAGDQLMIYIDSHGAEKDAGVPGHRIITGQGIPTNLDTLEGASSVHLQDLQELKALAKAKNIKMAIIDNSCHSGNSLDLADDNTCVISSTGPKHYGNTHFSKNFSAAMSKGKNLEEIFIEVRGNDETFALPMISSQAGLAVNSILYEKITPFFYEFDEDQDKLMPFLQDNHSDYHQCIADKNFDYLIKTIDQIESLSSVSKNVMWKNEKSKQVSFAKLKALLGNYKRTQDLARLKMRELNIDRLRKKENFGEINYTWRELLTTDFKHSINETQGWIDNESKSSVANEYLQLKATYIQANARKQEILKNSPDLINLVQKEAEIKKLKEENQDIVSFIAVEERKLYSALYKNAQKNEQSSKPNPCQNFKI